MRQELSTSSTRHFYVGRMICAQALWICGQGCVRAGVKAPFQAKLSAPPGTVGPMSSRIRSDFGTLAERSRASAEPADRTPLPTHAWARFDDGWRPALLLRWIRNPDNTWSGEIATTSDDGSAALFVMAAGVLRPSDTQPPFTENDGSLATVTS